MKQTIDLLKEPLSQNELEMILIWKKRKYNNSEPILSLGECQEYLISLTFNYHKDFSDGRFFNNIIINNESVIAWDGEGEELIDTIFYEIRSLLHKRLAQTKIL